MTLLHCLEDCTHGRRVGECNLGRIDAYGRADVAIDLGYGCGQNAGPHLRTEQPVRAALAEPKILVLTHSDDDHIGGFGCFANTICSHGLQHPEEVWVPATWGEAITAAAMVIWPALSPGQELNSSLIRDVAGPHGRGVQGVGWNLEDADCELEALGDAIADQDWAHGRPSTYKEIAELAAQKANQIIGVLNQVAIWGSTIRYFDANQVSIKRPPWKTEGHPGVATIINAREVRIVAKATSPANVVRALTPQNRLALATYIWPDQYDKGAIIWSDTSGTSCIRRKVDLTPWDATGVMTAPHHASADPAHEPIWRARSLHASTIPVILSGQAKTAHHPKFDALNSAERACTHCLTAGRRDVTYDKAVAPPCLNACP